MRAAPFEPALRRPGGVLFDMDGTLLSSQAVIDWAWTDFAERHGLDAATIIATCQGIPSPATIRHWLPGLADEGVDAEAARLLDLECSRTDGIVALPGASEILAWLDEASIPWAVVTSAEGRLARLRLEAAGLPVGVLVTAEQYGPGKPAPDCFWLGAERIGVPIEGCWVVEDSPAGLAAAEASGGTVVNVGPDGITLVDALAVLRPASR